ncbi:hypothetical protein MTR_2g018760 [Medicago truncatula]|uniref:Uncharacterized protein n=1 Tax=Medicago truncatula TaxID=3880 RepID=G7IP41_MEDTR|nr:hypothetical protein MTR_2g018760 [Medicago truncatula]
MMINHQLIHLWVYRIYTAPCIYLLKNKYNIALLKKIRFDFIIGLFSFREPNLRILRDDTEYESKASNTLSDTHFDFSY